MGKFFIPELALENARRNPKLRDLGYLDLNDIFQLGLRQRTEEVLYPDDESQHNLTTLSPLWHLIPFLRKMAAYEGLYISEHTDWSQWFADYDCCRMGWWLYMPEIPGEQLEAIEIFESFGEFPT